MDAGHCERNLRQRYRFLPRDYIQTQDGSCWAVVAAGAEQGRVLTWLRYIRYEGSLHKLGTSAACEHVAQHCPAWNFNSRSMDARVHGIPVAAIQQHFTPSSFFDQETSASPGEPLRALCEDLRSMLCEEFERHAILPAKRGIDPAQFGVTGSTLLGVQHIDSDIDLVVYGLANMQYCRQGMQMRMATGEVEPLSSEQWRLTYERRGCALSFDQYRWHEQRKWNKFLFRGIRVDLTCIDAPHEATIPPGRKLAQVELTARVTDSTWAFASPAVYEIQCEDEAYCGVTTLIATTPTYAGQALSGERVRFAGWLEQCDGFQRVVVGSSREAQGEFIKVADRL